MQLGAFSISLAVKDLHVSRAFYERLGFTNFAGHAEQNWTEADEGAAGPGSCIVIDPDSNPILVDQHR